MQIQRNMRYFTFLLLPASALLAQERPGTITYGFKIGSAINDPANSNYYQNTYNQGRWIGGPTIELALPYRFAVEFDALFWSNRTSESYSFPLGLNTNPLTMTSQQKVRSVDLPLLLKYRFQIGKVRPFISAGYLFTHESIDRTTFYQCQGPQGTCIPADYPTAILGGQTEESRFRSGPTAGAGLEFKTRYVTITPELRFSRLINTYPRDNRFTGMVGFTFGGKR